MYNEGDLKEHMSGWFRGLPLISIIYIICDASSIQIENKKNDCMKERRKWTLCSSFLDSLDDSEDDSSDDSDEIVFSVMMMHMHHLFKRRDTHKYSVSVSSDYPFIRRWRQKEYNI